MFVVMQHGCTNMHACNMCLWTPSLRKIALDSDIFRFNKVHIASVYCPGQIWYNVMDRIYAEIS